MIIARYNTNTGVIDGVLSVPDAITADLNVSEGFGWVEFPYEQHEDYLFKVDLDSLAIEFKTVQSLTASPLIITADGLDKSQINGIAPGSIASWVANDNDQGLIAIQGDRIDFATDIVGTHSLIIKNPACLNTTVIITAAAP